MVAAERADLVEFLRTLSGDDWLVPSLCEGWRVRDVVAHLLIDTVSVAKSGSPDGTVKLVSWLVAAKIGGRDRCIVVVQGTPLPGRDHRALRVAVSPVPAELS